MKKQWIKKILQKYIPSSIDYIFVIYSLYLSFFKSWRNLIFGWNEISIHKRALCSPSKGIGYKDVIERTFTECYAVLKKSNLIYLTQVNKGSYRFILLDRDSRVIYLLLLEILKLGYVIELSTKEEIRISFDKKSSFRNLKKNLQKFTLLKIYRIYKNSSDIEEFGSEISFEIEYWYDIGSYFITDSKNKIQNKLTYESVNKTTQVKLFNDTVFQIDELYICDKFKKKDRVDNIDLVYTWVDGSDSKWLKKKELYSNHTDTNILHDSSFSSSRFRSWDELKYSLRSVEKYLLGYRKIFIVVDGQQPSWLKESNRLILVDHKELFPNNNVLPVFNSHAIETVLHRIKGLSEHYLYFNDDILLGRSVDISLFFPKKGMLSIFPSTSTYIPFEKIDKNLLPVDTAAINTRNLLIQKEIGFARYKFKHTPLPQLKSLLFELENIFKKEVVLTRQNRFRTPFDISMTSSLLYNFSYLKDIAKEQELNYFYINLGKSNYIFILKKITTQFAHKRPDVFCVNDVDSTNLKDKKSFISILEHFLPIPSQYEK